MHFCAKMASDGKALIPIETLHLSGNQFSLVSCEHTGLFIFFNKIIHYHYG